jgi:hypothetical protein
MKARRASEFYYTGAVVLPGILWLAGDASLAILVCIFLILAGLVCSLAKADARDGKPPIEGP